VRTRRLAGITLALLATSWTSLASAAPVEPWSDADPSEPAGRTAFGDFGVRAGAEYRANGLYIAPVDLAAETQRKVSTIEHRLRLDGVVDYLDKIKLTASVDVLEGVLWGDNGNLGSQPEPSSGANVNTQNVNNARICVQQTGPSSVEPSSYAYGVCQADPLFIRRVFADVLLPFGLLRIGRQPATEGSSVALNDGNGRRNRFGFANRGNSADRILFATKPLEGFKPVGERDTSDTRGLFAILAYDRNVIDKPMNLGDDTQTVIGAARYLAPTLGQARNVEARLFYAHRWDRKFGSSINAIGGRVMGSAGGFTFGADGTAFLGRTREVSEAFAVITNDPPQSQRITQWGARAVARYDWSKLTAYLEADYASGDDDPQVGTPLTQFRFAEDSNVGLLMFKHVVAYQTARAAAAGVELLRSLNAPSYPVEAISTRGSFSNAMALFPQVDYRPLRDVLLRGGVLVAWAPSPVHDPIQSQQRRDGTSITDDLVNFQGGKPGKFYGTELDARVQYRYLEHVAFDLEGAYLFPGDALQDADGRAANSVMVQGRTTIFF